MKIYGCYLSRPRRQRCKSVRVLIKHSVSRYRCNSAAPFFKLEVISVQAEHKWQRRYGRRVLNITTAMNTALFQTRREYILVGASKESSFDALK